MDTKVDPCNDFYQFACGNYNKRVSLPDDEASMNIFVEIAKRINKEAREILEEPIRPDDPKSYTMAKLHYKACMNITQLETLGLSPLKELAKAYGGLPTLEGGGWINNSYDWAETEAKFFRDFGGFSIISFGVGSDLKNSSVHILEMDQGGLGLGKREYYLDANNSDVLEAYREYMINTAIQLGADKRIAERDINDLIDFETRLANITVRDEDRRNFTELYRIMSLGEIKQYYKLPLQKMFDLLGQYGWKLHDDREVNMYGDPFLLALPDVMANTSKRTLANHQIFGILKGFISYLPPKFKDNYRKYRKVVSGVEKDRQRWEECVLYVSNDLSLILSSMYTKKFFKPEDKLLVENMVKNINASMYETIQHIGWMDEETRKAALYKMSKMVSQMGYPPYIYNETRLLRDMEDIRFTASGFMSNAIELSRTSFRAEIRSLNEPVNRTDWGLTAADVNAQYSLNFNSITFPAGILQYPFFSSNAPTYFNYARIGSIIGHEITHGFDDEGRQFNEDGGLKTWWTERTLETFTNGSSCFIEQYGNITDKTTGLKLNGENTVGENIADNGGIKLAYKAYQLWAKKNVDTKLSRLSQYTTEQLFFITHGQVWCEIVRDKALKQDIITDPHSPARYRVNVPLRNFDAFTRAFKCPKGSPMNPVHKCTVW